MLEYILETNYNIKHEKKILRFYGNIIDQCQRKRSE